jgi:hypothetical protein
VIRAPGGMKKSVWTTVSGVYHGRSRRNTDEAGVVMDARPILNSTEAENVFTVDQIMIYVPSFVVGCCVS